VELGLLVDLAFSAGTEDIVYAADAWGSLVWRLDLTADRAYVAAGERLSVRRARRQRPDAPPRRKRPGIRFPYGVQPIGERLYVAEVYKDELLVLEPDG
jgi:hypothetical protein